MDSIYEMLKRQGMVNKSGGGTGFSFGNLREEGSPIGSTGGVSSGVMSFMELFNENGEVIKQGGKRRSANMGVLPIWHPEIEKFIEYKSDHSKLNNFNISVLVNDEFMEAVENDGSYNLVSPNGDKIVKTVKARDLFDKLTYQAWANAEPGILFLENINAGNPMQEYMGDIVATNPCGEKPLYPNEACNLASINIEEFVDWHGVTDWDSLEDTVRTVVRFLDTAIDLNEFTDPAISETVKNLRRIGLGIMSLHGYLIKSSCEYHSSEGRLKASEVMDFIYAIAENESCLLSEEKSVFPYWKYSNLKHPRRNVGLLTIAPTGTIQQILDTSSAGVEPVFAWAYNRIIDGETYPVINPFLEQLAKEKGFYRPSLAQDVAENNGKVTGIDYIPEYYQNLMKTSMEMTPKQHLFMQTDLQQCIDSSISKTINLPSDATVEEVRYIFMEGWLRGAKGLTVYRDGSRFGQVLSTSKKEQESSEPEVDVPEIKYEHYEHCDHKLKRGEIKEAPEISAESKTVRLESGCGTFYLTMTKDEYGSIDQTFVSRGSKGTCMANQTAVSRLMSLSLRGGVSVKDVVDQLKSAPVCPAYYGAKCKGVNVSKGSNCPSAIAYELEKYAGDTHSTSETIKQRETTLRESEGVSESKSPCPECGEEMHFEGGCNSCPSCGFSKCG